MKSGIQPYRVREAPRGGHGGAERHQLHPRRDLVHERVRHAHDGADDPRDPALRNDVIARRRRRDVQRGVEHSVAVQVSKER